ncbi:SusC/RagA family TonB-linked outer membrane protein [Sphingobacterium sp. UBA5996]|uniref:SusC/RagA family TonB-linked outer membrane protein n=1 Tax=Sphingobacterium sp. UBA5996 TaxID=1947505 RepID=UPI0025EDA680|nr:TonB-dependent receptor [Sphingobacterium sp. UBA5996]
MKRWKKIKSRLGIFMFLMTATCFAAIAQQVRVQGKVSSENDGTALSGVTVSVLGGTLRVSTDGNGRYVLNTSKTATLVFSSVGYARQEISLIGKKIDANNTITLDAQIKLNENVIDDVVVTGFGQREKRASVVGSVTTINPKELKGPTSNLTTMLAGRVAGMIAFQRSGEPGSDNANFFIRGLGSFGTGKQDPLILIDNIESSPTDMARLQPDDIASFSVLRDANAAAMYGARGANGVVLITTKLGKEGATKFEFRTESNISTNTRNFKFADNIRYMEMANEAYLTRPADAASGQGLPYWQNKIDHTRAGDNPLLYPNNNWIDQLIKDYTLNQRNNLNISGGGAKAKYYLSGTYNIDNGILKMNGINNFNNNIKLKNYSVRSNIDINFTPTTVGIVRVYAQFDDYNGPIGSTDENGSRINGGAATFRRAIWSNPVMFPAIYPSSYMPYMNHPLFGNALNRNGGLFVNPYAEMVRGYQEFNTSTIMPQIQINQNLNALIPGLSLTAMTYLKRYAYFEVNRKYNPFYYTASADAYGDLSLRVMNDGSLGSIGTVGTEYLDYSESAKEVNSMFYAHAIASYNHAFGKHNVGATVIGLVQNSLSGNAGNLQLSLPSRNIGLSGRFSYNFDDRYIAEFNFGYNGSERFAKNRRLGFFPSFGLSYNISNEAFFEPVKEVISKLKIRATHGFAGNDQIGRSQDRFFYLSDVNMNDFPIAFGELSGYNRPTIAIRRYANQDITWERSRQTNLGLELGLFKDLELNVDVYKQVRSNILTGRSYIPSTMGLRAPIVANTNKAESKGVDLTLNYNKNFGDSWYIQGRGTMTYAVSKKLIVDEPAYKEASRYTVGTSASQEFGYIAERLFVDDQEVLNSPVQFGKPGLDYLGGDIKYRDVNGDGQITDLDRVAIGYPTTPEMIYGFGGTVGGKGLDFSFYFQGSARSSFFINSENISPFYLNGGSQNGLLQVIADSYWSEENRNLYAFWPRLSENIIANNNQRSTWWMRSGAFLRLKTVEVGYTFKESLMKRIRAKNLRVYANGMNLFALSSFKMWDVEMGGKGIGYPIQSVYNIGLQLGF